MTVLMCMCFSSNHLRHSLEFTQLKNKKKKKKKKRDGWLEILTTRQTIFHGIRSKSQRDQPNRRRCVRVSFLSLKVYLEFCFFFHKYNPSFIIANVCLKLHKMMARCVEREREKDGERVINIYSAHHYRFLKCV